MTSSTQTPTVKEELDRLGRAEVAQAVGVEMCTIHQSAWRGCFPTHWKVDLDQLCDATKQDRVPDALFHRRKRRAQVAAE